MYFCRYAKLFIEARNASIEQDVTNSYTSLTNHHDLKVFCVSNRYYSGTQFTTNNAKDIARSLSGIPKLREFCYEAAADAQLHAAFHYLDVKCLGLLQQLRLWTQPTETETDRPHISPESVGMLRNVSGVLEFDCCTW